MRKGEVYAVPFPKHIYSALVCVSLPLKGVVYLLFYFQVDAVPLYPLNISYYITTMPNTKRMTQIQNVQMLQFLNTH